MEISPAHARELEKQQQRKAALQEACEVAFEGVDRILFEAGCGHGHWLTSYAETQPEQTCVGIDLISWRIRKGLDKRDKRQFRICIFSKLSWGSFWRSCRSAFVLI